MRTVHRFLSPGAVAILASLLALILTAPAIAKNDKPKPRKARAIVEHPRDLSYPPLPEITLPEPQRFSLDNGMQVLLLEDHELPLVQAVAFIRTGARFEPDDKVGLAQLTGTVMRSGGTESRASAELDATLENMAASVETSIGTTNGTASMSALAEDLGEVLPIFADVLRNPAFEEDKLAVAKTQITAAIARQNDSPGQILGRELDELIYGETSPYARPATYASVGAIGRDDLIAWHRRFYHPENVLLGLTGDFDAAEARALIEAAFGDWQRGEGSLPPVPEASAAFEPGVYFIEKSDVNQANIAIGHLGIERDNPDFFAVSVLNEVFGGSFAARLMSEVRAKKGLAYSVGGSVGANWDFPGLFRMQMSTKTETTGAGIEALMIEARRLREEPPTAAEVARAKEAMLASMVFTADDTGEILQRQLTYAYFGYPIDWLSRYQKGIEAVTPEEVEAAVGKYVHPERFAIVVVGPTKDTEPPLSSFGKLTDIDITIPEPAAAIAPVTAAGKARGAALIDQAVEAAGGAALIDGLSGLRLEADNQLVTPQGTFDISAVSTTVFPDHQRTELTLPFGTIVQVVSGGDAWMKSPQGVQTMPAPQKEQAQKGLVRAYHNLLRQRTRDDFVAAAVGPAEVDGTAVEAVQVEIAGQVLTLGIDPASGYILSLAYRGTNNAGAPGEVRQVNRDFRMVDGLLVAHQAELTFEGEPLMTINIKQVEINPQVAEDAFTRTE